MSTASLAVQPYGSQCYPNNNNNDRQVRDSSPKIIICVYKKHRCNLFVYGYYFLFLSSVGRARVAAEDAVEKIDRGNRHPVRPRRDGFFVRRLTNDCGCSRGRRGTGGRRGRARTSGGGLGGVRTARWWRRPAAAAAAADASPESPEYSASRFIHFYAATSWPSVYQNQHTITTVLLVLYGIILMIWLLLYTLPHIVLYIYIIFEREQCDDDDDDDDDKEDDNNYERSARRKNDAQQQ